MHLLRERQVAEHRAEEFRQRVRRASASLALVRREVHALRRFHACEIAERDPLLLRESERGRRGLAVRRHGRRQRRTGDRLLEILLALRHAAHARGQATGRRVGFDGRVGHHAEFTQARVELLRELRGQARQPCRGKFFDADLE